MLVLLNGQMSDEELKLAFNANLYASGYIFTIFLFQLSRDPSII